MMLELFTTSTCAKCAVLEKKLRTAGIPFVKRVINVDPEAQTDALMLGIHTVPVSKKDGKLCRVEDLLSIER